MSNSNIQTRRIDADIIKAFAILFVVYNHSSAYTFYTDVGKESPFFMPLLISSVLCKVGVPLYLGVSGALLLGKNEDIATIWLKRVLKAAVVLFLASAVYYILKPNYIPGKFSLSHFMEVIYSASAYGHLWYLYIYLTFLIALPFLRPMAQSLDEKKALYLCAIVLVFKIVEPALRALAGFPSLNSYGTPSFLLSNVVCFPLLGYWILNKADVARLRRALPAVLIVSACALILVSASSARIYETIPSEVDSWNNNANITTFVAVLVLVRVIAEADFSASVRRFFALLADNTLLVYLIHPAILFSPPLKALPFIFGYKPISVFPLTLLRCAIAIVVSEIVSALLLRIKPIRSFLLGRTR